MAIKRLLPFCLGFLLFAGCDSPSAPGEPRQAPTLLDVGTGIDGGPGLSALKQLARFDRAPLSPAIELGRSGPEGGRLSLGDFEVIVPAGAVDKPTLFKIRRPPDPVGRQYV